MAAVVGEDQGGRFGVGREAFEAGLEDRVAEFGAKLGARPAGAALVEHHKRSRTQGFVEAIAIVRHVVAAGPAVQHDDRVNRGACGLFDFGSTIGNCNFNQTSAGHCIVLGHAQKPATDARAFIGRQCGDVRAKVRREAELQCGCG